MPLIAVPDRFRFTTIGVGWLALRVTVYVSGVPLSSKTLDGDTLMLTVGALLTVKVKDFSS